MTRPSQQRSHGTFLGATGSTWRDPRGIHGAGGQAVGYREKSLVLTSALHEYRRLREEGKSINAGEFVEKFPRYRKSLLRLIDVEENIGDLGEVSDPFPVVGGEYLGFEIIDQLGMGAIARVYLAAEPELGGRIVVIKVAADGTAEAATLGKLQHPNIVQVYSVKRDPNSGMTAVCMPYQGSATLTDVLDLAFEAGNPPKSANLILDVCGQLADMEALRDDDLSTSKPDPELVHGSFVDGVIHLGIQLAGALEYAHEAGVLHRDLKPSNILLTPHGRPMLLDFNLSFDVANDAMPRGGTLPYMAPEQIRASIRGSGEQTIDPRSDIFSLGVILYELLTGRLPYGGPPEQLGPEAASLWQLNAHETRPAPIRTSNPLVPERVAKAIEQCIAADPDQRIATLAELKQRLNAHFSRPRRTALWLYRKQRWVQAAVAVMLVGLCITGSYLLLRPPFHERQVQFARIVLASNKKEKYEQAIRLLTPAIEHRPDFVPALELRAECYRVLKKRDEALVDIEQLVALRPTADVYDHLGCIYYGTNKLPFALNSFAKAIQLDPNQTSFYLKYAVAGLRMPQIPKDLEDYATRVIEMDSESAVGYLVRAEIRAKLKNQDQQLLDLKSAGQISRNSPQVLLYIAERLWPLTRTNPQLEQTIRDHLERAVHLGTSKSLLTSNGAFIKYQKQSWCSKLQDLAADVTGQSRFILQDLMVPGSVLRAQSSRSGD